MQDSLIIFQLKAFSYIPTEVSIHQVCLVQDTLQIAQIRFFYISTYAYYSVCVCIREKEKYLHMKGLGTFNCEINPCRFNFIRVRHGS